jgi:hypothetical protein
MKNFIEVLVSFIHQYIQILTSFPALATIVTWTIGYVIYHLVINPDRDRF